MKESRDLDPRDLLSKVARRTRDYDFGVWFWGDAIAIDGLLDAAELLGDEASLAHVQSAYRRWSRRELGWVDHLTPGAGLLRLADMTGEEWPVEAALRLAEHLRSVPRASGAPLYRPDIPMYRHTVWVDTLYHVPVFFARLGNVTADSTWFDAAIEEWRSHVALLSDPRGPFLGHSWDTGMHRIHGYAWGRGVGWALYGMVETLEQLPDGHSDRAWAITNARELADALLPVQDFSGFWHTLLHDREAYLESSTASFFSAAFARGMRSGLLDATFDEPTELAWRATQARIDNAGELWGVSACTYAGVANIDDVIMYHTLPTEVNVWGQGSALRAAAERIRSSRS
jgi:unsaturated rhamnogalacturonyl hydrolase